MSTELYYECLDHDPSIESDVVGYSSEYVIVERLRRFYRDREKILGLSEEEVDVFINYSRTHSNTWRFFKQHPRCELEIVDDNGKYYPIKPEPTGADETLLGRVSKATFKSDGSVEIVFESLTDAGKNIFYRLGSGIHDL